MAMRATAGLELHNIEFSCRPESGRYAPVRQTAYFLNSRTQADNCNDLLDFPRFKLMPHLSVYEVFDTAFLMVSQMGSYVLRSFAS